MTSEGVRIDLSTCVNRYGPPPAVLKVLRDVGESEILRHPHDSPDRLKALYQWATGADPDDLVAGRGVSEFLRALGRNVDHTLVAIPMPGRGSYLRAFPGRAFSLAGEQFPCLDHMDAAMSSAGLVIISNPHDPTGHLLPADGLCEVAERHPASVLVVDESYINFTPDPAGMSLIGCGADNVVVLRSPSRFYGIGACRVGVAWCRDRGRLRRLVGTNEMGGLSGLDVLVAEAAVRSWDWSNDARERLHADSAWLADAMMTLPHVGVHPNANVHFQYALARDAAELAASLARAGVGVRALGVSNGVRPGGLRIAAPRADERDAILEAFAGVGARVKQV